MSSMNKKNKQAKTEARKHEATATDKAIAEAVNKAKDKKVKDKKTPRVTIDSVTMDLLKTPGGLSLSDIHKELVKRFPKHDPDTLKSTTKRRLNGYLKSKHGAKIVKDDEGKYSIAA